MKLDEEKLTVGAAMKDLTDEQMDIFLDWLHYYILNGQDEGEEQLQKDIETTYKFAIMYKELTIEQSLAIAHLVETVSGIKSRVLEEVFKAVYAGIKEGRERYA